MSLAEKLFGSFSDRELKKINPLTKQVLALEGKYQAMSDAELQAQTPVLKQKLADGKTLDDILPDAFAVCREAAWRVLGMKHFPVQVTGGIALHRGDIAEMQTGDCFFPAIAGRTAGTRRTGIPMETARQLDRPGQQMVSPQPEQGRRPR